jgi:hypothetical protein
MRAIDKTAFCSYIKRNNICAPSQTQVISTVREIWDLHSEPPHHHLALFGTLRAVNVSILAALTGLPPSPPRRCCYFQAEHPVAGVAVQPPGQSGFPLP